MVAVTSILINSLEVTFERAQFAVRELAASFDIFLAKGVQPSVILKAKNDESMQELHFANLVSFYIKLGGLRSESGL